MINKIIITSPNDMHVHFRDDEMLKLVVPETDNIYENCIVMPNTVPPITNREMAKDYKLRINKYIKNGHKTMRKVTFLDMRQILPPKNLQENYKFPFLLIQFFILRSDL